MKHIFTLAFVLIYNISFGQNPTISVNSEDISGWGISCNIERGFINIADTNQTYTDNGISSNHAFWGEESDGINIADGNVVSLGDKGQATLSFNPAIKNGEGIDFAIFENAIFTPPTQDTMVFAELAFVEVSSNGIDFVRFPNYSNNQFSEQWDSFTPMNISSTHNLAGSTPVFNGTGFDLSELTDSANINIDSITNIRIIDVGGNIQDDYASYDSQGNIINDPWPTAFHSCGFDLDAVAAINVCEASSVDKFQIYNIAIYPNPASETIKVNKNFTDAKILIIRLEGTIIKEENINGSSFPVNDLQNGLYFIRIISNDIIYQGKFIKC